MNFQRVNTLDQSVLNDFVSFCLQSKPYNFCMLPSLSARLFQIKNYYRHLHQVSEVFVYKLDEKVKFFVAIKQENENGCIEFVYGSPFNILRDLKEFRDWYFAQNPHLTTIYTTLLREHKPEPMFQLVKKRDKNAKICVDNGTISVLWYKKNGLQT
jgi:hypothetical protein